MEFKKENFQKVILGLLVLAVLTFVILVFVIHLNLNNVDTSKSLDDPSNKNKLKDAVNANNGFTYLFWIILVFGFITIISKFIG